MVAHLMTLSALYIAHINNADSVQMDEQVFGKWDSVDEVGAWIV